MRDSTKILAAFALTLAVGYSAHVLADEASDALAKAPPLVQATVKTLVGKHEIKEFGAEAADGKTIYDLEYSIKGVNYAADIDPAGNIIEREVEIDLLAVPSVVIDAARKAHPDGKLAEASIDTAGDKIYYSLDVKVGDDTREVNIGADGKVIQDKIEAPEADEAKPPAKQAK